MAPEDITKTAIVTPFGLFEYKFMTYGLRNASQTFQHQIFRALGDLEFVFAFIDDILIASTFLEKHEAHLHNVTMIKKVLLTTQYREMRVRQVRIRIPRIYD